VAREGVVDNSDPWRSWGVWLLSAGMQWQVWERRKIVRIPEIPPS
jgi:hypothetical protein